MKPFYLFTLIVSLFLMTSACKDDFAVQNYESLSELENIIIDVPDTSAVVSKEKAFQIASIYENKRQISRTTTRFISSVESLDDSLGSPLLYVVNFANNKGFILISASKDYYPILAESEQGHFDLKATHTKHPINLWLEEQGIRIRSASRLSKEVRLAISSQWMEYSLDHNALSSGSRSNFIEKPQVYYDSLRMWFQDPNIEVYRYEDYINSMEYANLSDDIKEGMRAGMHMYGNSNYGSVESSSVVIRRVIDEYHESQLLGTKWSQGYPYNEMVPNGYPIGCTTIAAGQIMKYHRSPSRINWSDISDVGVTNTTKEFLYSLASNIGVEFGEDGSGASIDDVKNSLEGRYSYNVSKRDHNDGDVYRDVRDGYPVYMTGKEKSFLGIAWKGHAWVCDGLMWGRHIVDLRLMTLEYRPTTISTPNCMVEAYTSNIPGLSYSIRKYHFNWGWGGNCDGYYDDSNIKVFLSNGESREYKHARQNLYLRPKR